MLVFLFKFLPNREGKVYGFKPANFRITGQGIKIMGNSRVLRPHKPPDSFTREDAQRAVASVCNDYSEFVAEFNCTLKMDPDVDLAHHAMSLAAEAGEVVGYLSKVTRGKDFDKKALISELGDVLFHLEALCQNQGVTIDYLKGDNMVKLERRKREGTLVGNGSDR